MVLCPVVCDPVVVLQSVRVGLPKYDRQEAAQISLVCLCFHAVDTWVIIPGGHSAESALLSILTMYV